MWQIPWTCCLSFLKCLFKINFLNQFSPYVSVCRCWVSGGVGVSSGLGYFILDQLHHVHHHPPHCGPEPLGGFRPGQCGHHVRGRPPTGICPGWMSEVRCSFHNKIIISTFKTYSNSLTVPFSMPLLGRWRLYHTQCFAIDSHSSAFHQLDVLDQLEWAFTQYHARPAVRI